MQDTCDRKIGWISSYSDSFSNQAIRVLAQRVSIRRVNMVNVVNVPETPPTVFTGWSVATESTRRFRKPRELRLLHVPEEPSV
jgi:hypothetical protein